MFENGSGKIGTDAKNGCVLINFCQLTKKNLEHYVDPNIHLTTALYAMIGQFLCQKIVSHLCNG